MSGLMETILWSDGAGRFLDTLASTYPTVIAYVMDTPRCSDPAYFLTNMFYASSIFHKTSLPMVLVYNKTDVKDSTFAKAWMRDFDSCQIAIRQQTQGEDGNRGLRNVTGCIGPVLEEFNRRVEACPCMTILTLGRGCVYSHWLRHYGIFQPHSGNRTPIYGRS
jgi:hypothetical protein